MNRDTTVRLLYYTTFLSSLVHGGVEGILKVRRGFTFLTDSSLVLDCSV